MIYGVWEDMPELYENTMLFYIRTQALACVDIWWEYESQSSIDPEKQLYFVFVDIF
jgi:hypothetical protein